MLSFRLLGSASLFFDGCRLDTFRSQKEAALLFYLAQTERTHQRDAIAGLLWEDRSTKQALSNLRTAIARLRKQVGDDLLVTHRTLALAPESQQQVDSLVLLQTLANLGPVDSGAKAKALQSVLDGYQGDFLAGFSLLDAPEFDAWVLATREYIRRQVITAYEKLSQFALAEGDVEAGIALTRRWLDIDELDEGAHTLLIRLLLEDGQVSAATAHYKHSVKLLRAELDVGPPEEMMALLQDPLSKATVAHRQVDARQWVSRRAPDRIGQNLPITHDQFLGRAAALADIDTRLDQSWCRLVTLTGQGGVGKTRLAVTIAQRRLSRYQDGAWLVELAEIDPDDPALIETIAVEIAIAVELRLNGAAKPVEQLLDFLQQREMLLILDNFEHLLEGGIQVVLDILQRCERVQLIITSREALRIRAEWTIGLAGLSHPAYDDDERPCDAVDLFVARRAQRRRDDLTPDHRRAVRQICRMVEGLPLAIELAAALTQEASAQAVADELRDGFDVLTTSLRDVPDRHRSLQIVFQMSWRRLTPALQQQLARLSVFRGGFTRSAAQQITDAEQEDLAALCDKSLLMHVSATNRYVLHPVVQAYAAEKRAKMGASDKADAVDPALEKHAHYFLASLAHRTEALQKSQPHLAVTLIEPDTENVRLAWQTALATQRSDLLLEALEPLSIYYQLRGLAYEAEGVMQSTIRKAATWDGDGSALAIRAGLERARFQIRLGRYGPAIESAEMALHSATADGDRWAEGMGHVLWGEALWRLGKYELAESKLEHALAIAHAIDSTLLVGWCYHHLGVIDDIQSRHAMALEHLQQACDAWQAIDNAQALSNSLNSIALVRYHQGDLPAAQLAMEQALAICEQIDDRHRQSNLINNLSMIANEQGDYVGAHYYLQLGLNLTAVTGDRYVQGAIHNNLGKNYRLMGNFEAAEKTLVEGMQIVEPIGDPLLRATALLYLAETKREQGDIKEAESCYQQALEIARQDKLAYIECEVLISWVELLRKQDEPRAKECIVKAIALAKTLQNAHLLQRAAAIADYLGVSADTEQCLSG